MNTIQQTFFASFQALPFSIIAKPAGASCNLNCTYCYYLDKKKLYPETKIFRMNDEVLENFIKQYIQSQHTALVSFVWQGGEPCLAGIDFYKKAIFFQQKYADGKQIENAFQTNGTLINDEWCSFFYANRFLVGISVDGPQHIHDKYRRSNSGGASFHKVLNAVKLFQKYRIEFNTLTTVNSYNAEHAIDIYRFLKSIGSVFMQFIPVVERIAHREQQDGLQLIADNSHKDAVVTDWSVTPMAYGAFMCSVFDEWICNDVGLRYVQLFDATLAAWLGMEPGLCFFMPACGNSGVIEYNGDVYSCDHLVSENYYLGNLQYKNLGELMNSALQQQFGQSKYTQLPNACLKCNFLNKCYGECPKKRFLTTADGEYGLNYLCEGYKRFFTHVAPAMDFMANELKHNRPPANVMTYMKELQNKKP